MGDGGGFVGVSWGGGRLACPRGVPNCPRDTAGTDQPVLGLKTGYGVVSMEGKVVMVSRGRGLII